MDLGFYYALIEKARQVLGRNGIDLRAQPPEEREIDLEGLVKSVVKFSNGKGFTSRACLDQSLRVVPCYKGRNSERLEGERRITHPVQSGVVPGIVLKSYAVAHPVPFQQRMLGDAEDFASLTEASGGLFSLQVFLYTGVHLFVPVDSESL